MTLDKKDLIVICNDMTERLIKAAGLVKLSDDIAQTLANLLPGRKILEFQSTQRKVSAILKAYDPDTDVEQYNMKVSFNPEKASIKLDNFYVVDPAQRGMGIGRKGLRNIYDLATEESVIKAIELTATLDNGAYVWAKMGFRPHEGDFAKIQKAAREKLYNLQAELPEGSKIDPDMFAMADHLLDHERVKDPRALWAIADMNVTIPYSYADGLLVETPKKLGFILLEWMEYRGKLDLSNAEQVVRLETALGPRPGSGAFERNEKTPVAPIEKIQHDQKTAQFNLS